MRLDQINSADQLARELASMKRLRDHWSKVDLTDIYLVRRINDNCNLAVLIPDDNEMESAIVQAILDEYDRRISTAMNELSVMGVEI